jgi:hypothetical protein
MAENLDPEVIARLNEAYRDQYESLRSTNLLADAQLKAERAKIDLSKNSAAAFQASTQAVESFTRILISNESSFKQVAAGVNIVTDTVSDMAKQMGGFAGVLGVAVQAAGKLVQAMAAQADAMVKTKDQVSKFGAAFDLSSNQLVAAANAAGYYSLNMKQLYTAAGKAGGDLLVFSKNMSRGVEAFANMAAVGDDVLSEFNSLGIPKEELADYMAEYVKYLGSTNIQLNASQKTQAALQKGSLEYTKNILELSALTGKDVDTVKKKQQEAQASLDIQIHYNKLQRQANQLRESGDETGAKELEAQIEREKAIVTKMAATFDGATTAAVRNVLATGGSLTEVSAALAAAGIDVREFVRLSKDESLTGAQAAAQATEVVAQGVDRSMKTVGDAMVFGNDAVGKAFGVTVENLQALARGAKEAVDTQKDLAEKIAKGVADALKAQQNEYDIAIRNMQVKGDQLVLSVNPFANDMATIMKNAKKIMEDSWESLKKNILEPANKFINDVFGVDLMAVTSRVITVFGQLAIEAKKLWDQFGGLSGLLDTLGLVGSIGAGAATGAAIGSVIPGVGTAVGAGIGAVGGYALNKMYSGDKGGGKTGGAASDFGAFDSGVGGYGGGSLKGDTGGLNSDLQKRLMAASEVYGKPLTVNSGYRSSADQQRLYDESVRAGRPGKGPNGMPIAKPGSSSHEKGMAVDIQEYKDPKAVAALRSQGLIQTVSGDPVHFEVPGPKTEAASGSSAASGTAVQSSAPTTTAMSSSDDTLIRVMVDMRNTINTKMQEMVDKVAESNGILEKIMRRS